MQHEHRSRGPGRGAPSARRRASDAAVAGTLTAQARYPLPKATVAVLRRHGKPDQPFVGDNRSLALNKLAGPWATLDGNRAKLDGHRGFLEALCEEPNEAREVRQFMWKRRQALVESYRGGGWIVHELTAKPAWRFISGLGMANPLEANLVLHRIGGFPYIPGSSIKGAVRAYAEFELGVTPQRPQARGTDFSEKERDLLEVFGAQDQAGKVIFLDALPVTGAALELDVINVHYREYYQEGKPPADWQDPVPVLFLAVGKETQFTFAVASREPRLADLALRWLQGALQTTGLGGKTSAGYGFFQLLAAPTQRMQQDAREGRRS